MIDWRGEFYRHDPKLPLEAEEKLLREDERLVRLRVEFTGMHDHRVPAILTLPKGVARPPVLLVLHGVTGSKEAPYVRAISRGMREAGFATIAIDSQYHGDRVRHNRDMRFHNYTSYTNRNAAIQSSLDCMRALDYVASRPDLDSRKIVFVGFSQGTIVGTPFCARDPRVGAVALIVGGGNFIRLYPPAKTPEAAERARRIAETIDPVNHVALIAPRPLLMVNATRDELIPRAATEDLFEAAREPKTLIWYDATHRGLPPESFVRVREFLVAHAGEGARAAPPDTP